MQSRQYCTPSHMACFVKTRAKCGSRASNEVLVQMISDHFSRQVHKGQRWTADPPDCSN